MPKDDALGRVEFQYRCALDYHLIHATGAAGGVTPGGDVKFDLFSEFANIPDVERWSLNEKGALQSRIPPESKDETITVLREKQVGVVMSLGNAEGLANWLLKKVLEAKEHRKHLTSEQGEEDR